MRRVLISTAFYTLVVVALLAIGGLYVRSVVARSFQNATVLRSTRALAYDTLRYMLDEETGVRGFAATHQRVFLEPYRRAVEPFRMTLQQLRAAIVAIDAPGVLSRVDDLATLNADYLHTVAAPLLAGAPNSFAHEFRGKSLVDRFRADIAEIDRILTEREAVVTAQVQSALDRIGFLVGGAIAIVLLLAIFYTAQQASFAAAAEDERIRAEERRREAEVLRAAYAAEKRIADLLQRAFAQRPLPTHPTLRFSATYVPASEEALVGGDWYDALELPGGRVLFVIGDVTGHGIEAAVTMNHVRQALITSALIDVTPSALLARVSDELHDGNAPLVTAVTGYADANTYEFVYSTAGHPPPLLIEPGRAPRLLDFGSLPLGAVMSAAYRTYRVQSVPGATLVLYTDGAVEHSRDVIAGEKILLAAAAEAARAQTNEPATFIHNKIFNGRHAGDDVAILTVGFAAQRSLGLNVTGDRAQSAFTGRVGGDNAESSATTESNSRGLCRRLRRRAA
jgi:serine phosphatase RsbU (regulator of sigma subunit)/CHASE3 domain sensor protein